MPVQVDKNNSYNVETEQTDLFPAYHHHSISRQFCKITNNKYFPVLIYVAIVMLTFFALLLPLFVQYIEVENISKNGIFGNDLRTSTRLMIMESISIGCTLPMLSDNFLDRVTDRNTKMTLSMWHRILFLMIFSIAGILYLSLSEYYFMPYLYIVLSRFKVLVVGAITAYAVATGTIVQSLKGKLMFVVAVLIVALYFVLETYSLLYPDNQLLSSVHTILFYTSLTTSFGVEVSWYYILWCRYRVNKTLNNEEKKEVVYMLAMLFYVVACQLVNVVFGWPYSWLNTGENILVGYIVVQIVCILLATVLPTWFMRKVVQVSQHYLYDLNSSCYFLIECIS